MKATVRRLSGIAMAGIASSGHWVAMDTKEEVGGFQGASSPLELLLIGLGGCTGMDVLSILAKKRIKLDDFEIELDADRATEHPRVFTAIRVVFHFYGENLNPEDLQHAVDLSEQKYCSATAMLRRACPIEVRVELHPPRPPR